MGFAIHQHESTTGIHVFPILNPPPSSLLLPHTISLGRPSAAVPSIQYHAWNLDWQLISYMILYMFQCHSPKSSHPLPLPQRNLILSLEEVVLFRCKITGTLLEICSCVSFIDVSSGLIL